MGSTALSRFVGAVTPLATATLLLVGCSDRGSPVSPPEPPARIVVTDPLVVLRPGEAHRLGATVFGTAGQVLQDVAVVWASSDTLTAGVTANGLVTGVGGGRTIVSASAGSVAGTADIRVTGVNPAKASSDGRTIWFLPNRWTDLIAAPPDTWASVRERAHVAKLYPWWLDDTAPDSLETLVSLLNASHIAIAIETGGLRDLACSGAENGGSDLRFFARIAAAGGVISYISLDTPFGHALESTGRELGCSFSAQRTSEELLEFIRITRAAHPRVLIGLTEPVPWYRVGPYESHPGQDFGDLLSVMDTLLGVLDAAGETLAFFHADSPFDYTETHPAGWEKLVELERQVRMRGVDFGLIYNSEAGGTTSDERFHRETLAGLASHWGAGGRPGSLIVQSWYPLPSLMAPETRPYTFTNVLMDFIAAYDALTLPPRW